MAKHKNREIFEALRKEGWTLRGPRRPVKIVGRSASGARPFRLSGYFTLACFLKRLTPIQMERELGLPSGTLYFGAEIYSFKRLPNITEYEYELTLDFPGGTAYTFSSDPIYQPGNPQSHQWRIKAPSSVPVDLSSVIVLKPNERFTG